ncbi:MAG: hypothetical protein ACE5JB_15535 [bacterium]
MKARIAFFVAFLIVLNLTGVFVYAKKSPVRTPFKSIGKGPNFYLDYTNFQGFDDDTFIEFYIQIGYQELQFFKHNKRFRAGYDLDLFVYDENDNTVEHYTNLDVFEVDSYSESQSTEKARVSLLGFSFNPGKYKIEVILRDIETHKSSKIERVFFARNYQSDNLQISDIQFSQKIVPAEEGQPYVKNQRYIQPNPIRTFAHGLADIYIYFEVYNLTYTENSENLNYTAYFIILDNKGKKIAQFQNIEKVPGKISAHSLKIPVDQFLSGNYILTVRILDEATGQTAETSKSFTVLDWPISLNDVYTEEVIN